MQTSSSEISVELLRDTTATQFVINLCASTTPVALAHPASPELKRFTFFVTRRREEGRERFRLHMGYFDSLATAEAMLAVVRDVYPAAWAGPAPDNRAPARSARPAIAAVKTAPAPAAPTATVLAAPVQVPAVVAPTVTVTAAPVQVPPVVAPTVSVTAALVQVPPVVAPTVPVPAAAVQVAPVIAQPAPANPEPSFDLGAMSNVREVIAQLADEPAAPPKPAAPKPVAALPAKPAVPAVAAPAAASPAAKAPPAAVQPTAQPVAQPAKPVGMPAAAPRQAQRAAPPAEVPTLTAAQTLRVLETPAPLPDVASNSTANNIKVLTPEDTQTLRDIKLDAQTNASTSYAVQLIWAVQPIAMDALPHLAIFDAYTLYHVEGNRQGRRWYGLRLGFFSDAGAAKQVAYYVRSEYASVAVVPVTAKEKDGASAPTAVATPAPQAAAPPRPDPAKIPTIKPLEKSAQRDVALTGFELLPDMAPAAAKRDLDDMTGGAATRNAKPSPPKATGKPAGKRAVARPKKPSPPGAAQPLDSTLEILGASTLTLDESREIINDSAIRKARPKKEKAGRFSRLLSRLSDKITES